MLQKSKLNLQGGERVLIDYVVHDGRGFVAMTWRLYGVVEKMMLNENENRNQSRPKRKISAYLPKLLSLVVTPPNVPTHNKTAPPPNNTETIASNVDGSRPVSKKRAKGGMFILCVHFMSFLISDLSFYYCRRNISH